MDSGDPQRFREVCATVARVARNAGVSIAKVPGSHALAVSGNGSSMTFPIPCDEADWRKTSPEEAFYSAVVDAIAWAGVSADNETLRALDDTDQTEVVLIRKDLADQHSRLGSLEAIVGGRETLASLIKAAELDPSIVAK